MDEKKKAEKKTTGKGMYVTVKESGAKVIDGALICGGMLIALKIADFFGGLLSRKNSPAETTEE